MSTLFIKLFSFLLRFYALDNLQRPAKFIASLLRFYRSDIIADNLQQSFTHKRLPEINKLRQSYRNQLCHVIVETLKGFSIPQAELADRFIFKNPEVANKYHDEGKSIILALGHIGNWEWGQAVVSYYLKHKCVGVYKPLSNRSLDKFILQRRSQYGVKLLPQKELLKYLISHQEETNVYIFIADQYPPVEPRVKLNFLNRPTFFDTSLDKIARKYDLPVIYADIKKVANARYETELIEVSDSSSICEKGEITSEYAELLEKNIIKDPKLWLWSHRRWK